MGKTWRKKTIRGRKGKPHAKGTRGLGVKTQRALRQELEIQQARVNQPQEKKHD